MLRKGPKIDRRIVHKLRSNNPSVSMQRLPAISGNHKTINESKS